MKRAQVMVPLDIPDVRVLSTEINKVGELIITIESNSPHSIVYDDHLLLQLVNSTVADVSIKECVGYDCVLGVLERRISASVDWWQYTALGVVGRVEIRLKKGHSNF